MRYILLSILSIHFLFAQFVVLHHKGNVFWEKSKQEKVLLKRLDTLLYYGKIYFEDEFGYIALYDLKRRKALEVNGAREKYYDINSLFGNSTNYSYSFSRYVLSYSSGGFSARNTGVTLGAVSRGLSPVNIITPNKTLFYRDSIVINYNKLNNTVSYEIELFDYNGNLIKTFNTQDTFIHIKYDSLLSNIYYYYTVHPKNKFNKRVFVNQHKQSFFVTSSDKELDLMNRERDIIDLYKQTRSFKHFYNLITFYYENNMYNKMVDWLNKYKYSLYTSTNNDLILVKDIISYLDYEYPIILHSGSNNVYFYIIKGDFIILCNWCDYYNILLSLSMYNNDTKFCVLIVIENDKYVDTIEHYLEVKKD